MEIYGKIAVVLFKTFFDANTAREFLQNGSNFKDSERFNFQVRWFKPDDEFLISESLKAKMRKFSSKFMEMHNGMNYNNNVFGYYNHNYMNEFNMKAKNFNIGQNMNGMGMNMPMQMGMQNMQMQMPMHMHSMQNIPNLQMSNMNMNQIPSSNNSFNSFKQNQVNETEEKKSQQMQNGKYTCRFEIQIENDKDFQVARRLIGAKVIYTNPGL